MKDGEFSNISGYIDMVIAGQPQINIQGVRRICRATRIGNLGYVEILAKLSEDFGFEDPEVYAEDRFGFRIRHPYWQFAPVAMNLGLDGNSHCDLYLQQGSLEGRYQGGVTVKSWGGQGYLASMWLPETSAGRNGRVEKVCMNYPHWVDDFQLYRGAWLKLMIWSEFTPIIIPQSISYRLTRPARFSAEELSMIGEFEKVAAKYG